MMTMEKLMEIRAKILRKEPVSKEELAACIEFLRQGRRGAEKERKEKKSAQDILDSILGDQA